MHQSNLPVACAKNVAVILFMVSAFVTEAKAQLTLAIDPLTSSVTAGTTVDFTGVITNQSGQSLESTDFFFNFFNYDPTALNPDQLLGSTEFTLPDNTYSSDTLLFSVALAPALASGPQGLGVTLEDAYGDISNEVDITAQVVAAISPPTVAAPEIDGSSAISALTLLIAALAILRRRAGGTADSCLAVTYASPGGCG